MGQRIHPRPAIIKDAGRSLYSFDEYFASD